MAGNRKTTEVMNSVKAAEQYTDIEVIEKILQGDTALFEIIIRRYNPALHKTGRAYGYNHEDTQDLMQETFVSAYLHLAKFENRSSLKTWLIKIMLRNCSHRKQKLSYTREMPHAIPDKSIPMFSDKSNDGDKEIVNREFNYVIEKALMQIPEAYRLVFSLREINGLNVAETAEALDISETNVKARLSRARVMLRKELEKAYTPEDIFDFNLIYCDAMVNRVMNEINKLKA
jgi:RNA polymerase sigma factor (sigma-70 family)